MKKQQSVLLMLIIITILLFSGSLSIETSASFRIPQINGASSASSHSLQGSDNVSTALVLCTAKSPDFTIRPAQTQEGSFGFLSLHRFILLHVLKNTLLWTCLICVLFLCVSEFHSRIRKILHYIHQTDGKKKSCRNPFKN